MVNELKCRISVKKNHSNLLWGNSHRSDHPGFGQLIIKAGYPREE